MTRAGRLLLIETATSQALVGLADTDGRIVAGDAWQSGHRPGEQLLPRLDQLLSGSGIARADLAGVAVGTGPGSFTGLRIGMATAKTICHGLGLPIIGLPTMALLGAAGATEAGEAGGAGGARMVAVVLPAGVGDRYVARYSVSGGDAHEVLAPTLTAAKMVAELVHDGDDLVAVDIAEPEAPPQSLELGRRAQAGMMALMAAHAARRLADGESADLASLVPQYVALPRGVADPTHETAWSPDLR